MNKKLLCLIISALLLLTVLASCADDEPLDTPDVGTTVESGDSDETSDTSDSQGNNDNGGNRKK